MRRTRLTITLREDTIKEVDKIIDGSSIRNRSHAIEFVLQKSFIPKVREALILAGGKGLHLRPYTYEMPKCMLPVSGKPVLEHVIELFRKNEIRDLVISIGYLGDKIKEYFGDGNKFGVSIKYIRQAGPERGTAPPVRQAKKYMSSGSPFILYYGDVLAEVDLRDLIDFHTINKSFATMALTSVAQSSKWGMVALHGTKIIKFSEKPDEDKTFSHLINAGIYVLNPKIFESISSEDKKLEDDVFPRLAREGKLVGYAFDGAWFDIGDLHIYEKAVKEWKKA